MNFIINYKVELKSGVYSKKMKVKNQLSGLNAKVNLERFLEKKHIDFKRLVIVSCTEDNLITNLFNSFK